MPPKNDGEKHPQSAPQKWNRYKRKKSVFFGLARFLDTYSREQNANRKQEEAESNSSYWIEIATLVFVIGTFFGIVVQDVILHRTDETTKNAYIASNRPWIKVESVVVDKIEIQKDQVLVWAHFNAKNIGHSPAQKVSIFPRLLLPELEPWGWREAKSLCEDIKSHPNMVFGPVVFPDEQYPTNVFNFGRPMKDITEAMLKRAGSDYVGWINSFGQEEADRFRQSFFSMSKYTDFDLVACTSYLFGGEIHQTSNIYEIKRTVKITDETGVSTEVFDVTKMGTVGTKEILVTPIPNGSYAD